MPIITSAGGDARGQGDAQSDQDGEADVHVKGGGHHQGTGSRGHEHVGGRPPGGDGEDVQDVALTAPQTQGTRHRNEQIEDGQGSPNTKEILSSFCRGSKALQFCMMGRDTWNAIPT